MWREFEWARGTKSLPSVDDYMSSAYVSVALGPVALVPLYFLGAKLSEEAVKSKEYDDLFMHMSVISRLLNDLTTVKARVFHFYLFSISQNLYKYKFYNY